MTIKYSSSQHSCYDTALDYPDLPEDLIEITAEDFEVWLSQAPEGKELKKHQYPFEYEDSAIVQVIEDFEGDAKELRDELVSSDIIIPELDNASFQCSNQAEDLKGILSDYTYLTEEEVPLTVQFRLSDNTWKEVSKDDIELVLNSYVKRKKVIWTAYAEWDLGDKTSPFSMES